MKGVSTHAVILSSGAGVFRALPPRFAGGFTTRALLPDDLRADVGARRLANALGAPDAEIVRLRQVHGRNVLVLEEPARERRNTLLGEGDALVTNRPSVLLTVASADCVPIVLADPSAGLIAAVHAGWRGTALRVLDAVLDALEERGAHAGNLVAAFGPSISPRRYEVGPEVVAALVEAYREVTVPSEAMRPGASDRTFLDIGAFHRALLLRRGIRAGRILTAGLCNASRPDLFPSYRRDGPGTGRILTGIVRL
jgi:YfiH family protein